MIRSWVTKLQKRERGENKYFCWDSANSYIIKSVQALGGLDIPDTSEVQWEVQVTQAQATHQFSKREHP